MFEILHCCSVDALFLSVCALAHGCETLVLSDKIIGVESEYVLFSGEIGRGASSGAKSGAAV